MYSRCGSIAMAKSGTTSTSFIWLWTQNLPWAITHDPENPIDDMGFADGVIAHPEPFTARFQPRFGDEASLRIVMAQCGEGL
ncbi:hypothetical protein EDB19DRAFT_2023995 [Suillus lakei]|nr:hypothetical protein EDB19DRAFT_2023995 [Suillus lakei]